MTMDITSRLSVSMEEPNHSKQAEFSQLQHSNYIQDLTLLPKRATIQKTKRCFDVAFLITPDENLAKKKAKEVENEECIKCLPTAENLIVEKSTLKPEDTESIRSAFKKVGLQKSMSPSSVSSMSGGCSYQESRSPSPCSVIDPVRTPSPQFKTDAYPMMTSNIFSSMDLYLKQSVKEEKEKRKTEIPAGVYAFSSFQPRHITSPDTTRRDSMFPPFPTISRNFIPTPIFSNNLIAAQLPITASLIPSSLAALTLPAQNICAKCNVSFRMTSDLVYHMRSHHKNDHNTTDNLRRRRDLDKLRCPVCNESFRERHHLTRHMTAHQDKDGDDTEIGVKNYDYKNKSVKH